MTHGRRCKCSALMSRSYHHESLRLMEYEAEYMANQTRASRVMFAFPFDD